MAATSAPTSEYRRAAPDSVVSAANGIDYAYRQIGGGSPALVLCSTTSAPRWGLRPLTMTCAPSAANAVAIARPMLLVAPVTSAVLSASRLLIWGSLRGWGQRVLIKATTVSAPAAAMAPATSSIASTPCA